MSTDSKPHSTAQPPLSQLWPGFGTTTSDTIIMGSPLEQQQHQQQHKSINMTKQQQQLQQQQNNNSNYVNFNQFIMQHNLAPSQQTKPQLTSPSMDSETITVREFAEVSDYIHNIGGALNNNNNKSAKDNGNSANTNYRQQQQHQYNVSKQKKKDQLFYFSFVLVRKCYTFEVGNMLKVIGCFINIVDDVQNIVPLLLGM